MDWFIFVLISLGWITSLFFLLEKKTIIRTGLFAGFSFLIGGGLLADGISFPSGWMVTIAGSTRTIVQTFTTYTQANNPWILGIGWMLLFTGLYFLIEVWAGIITSASGGIERVRNKYGL